MIEIINLKKQFKTKGKNGGKTVKTAIDNLSLAINDGEIFGLLGPNGAGKTTLVSMLAMLMRPCGGEILYDGKNAFANETFVKSQIGVVPQHINFDQDLTVWENMELHGRLHHLPEKERHARIDELLEYCWLAGAAQRKHKGAFRRNEAPPFDSARVNTPPESAVSGRADRCA